MKVKKEKPVKEKPAKKEKVKKAPKAKKSKKVEKYVKPIEKGKRGEIFNAVLAIIVKSPEGITTAELAEKSGLTDKQIWPVISRAEKMGKVKKAKRGLYTAA